MSTDRRNCDIVHKKFPDGNYYGTNDKMEFRLCGNAICTLTLSDTWHKPFCPGCTFQKNARTAFEPIGVKT